MRNIELSGDTDFEGWREAARRLCAQGVAPSRVNWITPDLPGSLLAEEREAASPGNERPVRATAAFVEIARRVVCHRDPARFARLYAVLVKLQTQPEILSNIIDPDVAWIMSADKSVRRDVHKMHAFVRFRFAGHTPEGREQFAAWHEPDHFITALAAGFFQRRFPNMDWIIVTPHATAIWDGETLALDRGGSRNDVPAEDGVEDQWRAYFQNIFNPARLKIDAMRAEMPKKFWKNLPEAALIPGMVAGASARVAAMREHGVSEPNDLSARLSGRRSEAMKHAAREDAAAETLAAARAAVQSCTRCPLSKDASQAVFGEGPEDARIMLVGEQPGDQEDIAGRPFVGLSGQLLDKAVEEAGLDRSALYVTNAVKHFKFERRGKRRMHARPNAGEIDICRWWLDLERGFVKPDVIVALGASAARGVLGKAVTIGDVRRKPIMLESGAALFVTVHPSYLLRLPDAEKRASEHTRFVEDLHEVRRFTAVS